MSAGGPSAAHNWKKLKKNEQQKKTFTNWFNDRLRGNLKVSKQKVDDLFEDLKDGLILMSLVEQLAKPRKIPRYNKKANNKIQAIENLGFVLKFIASENIKLVNIGEFSIITIRSVYMYDQYVFSYVCIVL